MSFLMGKTVIFGTPNSLKPKMILDIIQIIRILILPSFEKKLNIYNSKLVKIA